MESKLDDERIPLEKREKLLPAHSAAALILGRLLIHIPQHTPEEVKHGFQR